VEDAVKEEIWFDYKRRGGDNEFQTLIWCGLHTVLSGFAKFSKTRRQVCPSVRPPTWNNWAPNGRIFMKFDISVIFLKSVEKIHALLKYDKNDGNFT